MENPTRRAAFEPIVMLHVFPSFGYGGQQARFAALARGLGAGFRHEVVSLDGDMEARALYGEEAPVTCRSFVAQKSSFASLSNIKRFRNMIAETQSHILCTYNWGAIEAVIANRFGPRIPHLHFEDGFGPGEGAENQPARRVLARRLLLSGSMVILPSQGLADAAAKIWKLKPQHIQYIPNGVDFDRLQNAKPRLSTTVHAGTVGAMREEKNHRRLIKAFAEADREKRASLTIIGGGPERDRMIALVKELGAEDRITLPGPTKTPEEAYSRFDIFALSSDTEQAPLSLMEAMAAGLPVIATNVGDIAHMVSTENRAFITPLGDEEAYVHGFAQLLQNPTIRAQLGAANRQKAKAEFSIARMIEAHRSLYLSTVAGRG